MVFIGFSLEMVGLFGYLRMIYSSRKAVFPAVVFYNTIPAGMFFCRIKD